MAMRQEPIIFNFKPGGIRNDAPALNKLSQVTLLINPETITIPWKKIITRVRTKSRIVSLYWGQEPLTLSYKGQTGNLYPIKELSDMSAGVQRGNSQTQEGLLNELTIINKKIKETELETESTTNLEDVLDRLSVLQQNRLDAHNAIDQLRKESTAYTPSAFTDGMTHTEIIKLSPKYQRFDALRKLYEKSQTIPELMYVKYRDWVFEGYFENFNFTDDVKSSWNWTYNLTFIILNWDEYNFSSFTASDDEVILVPDIQFGESKVFGAATRTDVGPQPQS